MVKVTYKGETRDIPKRYLPDSLKGKDRQAQIKSIFEGKERPQTKVKDKKSTWTIQFDKEYGEKLGNDRSKKNIAKVTGIPFKAIDEVYGWGTYTDDCPLSVEQYDALCFALGDMQDGLDGLKTAVDQMIKATEDADRGSQA